jgi:flagellar hook-length control protein FliK
VPAALPLLKTPPKSGDAAPPPAVPTPLPPGERFADALDRSKATHGLQGRPADAAAPKAGADGNAANADPNTGADEIADAGDAASATSTPRGAIKGRAAARGLATPKLAPSTSRAPGSSPADDEPRAATPPRQPIDDPKPAQNQPTAVPVDPALALNPAVAAPRGPAAGAAPDTTATAQDIGLPPAAPSASALPAVIAGEGRAVPAADKDSKAAAAPVPAETRFAAAFEAAHTAAATTAPTAISPAATDPAAGLHFAQGLLAGSSMPLPRGFDASAPAPITLPVPLHSPEFAQALGTQVSLLARDGIQQAELRLHPAELGPINVQIEMTGTQARIDFTASAAATRQVIETGLPELASALRDQGLTLSGGGVFQQAPERREPQAGRAAEGAAGSSRVLPSIDAVASPARSATRTPVGMLDLYA